jgi:hypothetical protein
LRKSKEKKTMSDLTQEEIDALISGTKTAVTQEALAEDERDRLTYEEIDAQGREDISSYFTAEQIDALGEIGNICMGTSATTMYALLGRRVNITTPTVGLYKAENVLSAFRWPFLAISVEFKEGMYGKNLLIIKDYEKIQFEEKLLPLLPSSWHEEFLYWVDDEFENKILLDREIRKGISCEEIHEKYNEDRFSPLDGRIIEACDQL